MTQAILIGNLISFVAACFTFASSWVGERKQIYLLQAVQCFLIAISNIFFASYSGCLTLLLCALRNVFSAYDKLTRNRSILFIVVMVPLGILFNNRGILGLLPVVTTVIYTLGCAYAKRIRMIKANVILNLVLWAIYDIFVMDFVSLTVDTISVMITGVSILKVSSDAR